MVSGAATCSLLLLLLLYFRALPAAQQSPACRGGRMQLLGGQGAFAQAPSAVSLVELMRQRLWQLVCDGGARDSHC